MIKDRRGVGSRGRGGRARGPYNSSCPKRLPKETDRDTARATRARV